MTISPENEHFINHVISLGLYGDRDEALDAGVRLLRERQQLKEALAKGRKQLDEGDYLEFDREGLHAFFDTLKQRAQSKADSPNGS